MGQGSPKHSQPGLEAGGGGRRGWRSKGLALRGPGKAPQSLPCLGGGPCLLGGEGLAVGSMDRRAGVLPAAGIVLAGGPQPDPHGECSHASGSSGSLRWGCKFPPWKGSPRPSLPGPLFRSVFQPWVTLGMLEPTSPGKLPWEPASRGVDSRGAGAPHGPVRPRRPAGAGHRHLQGPGAWRGKAFPARLLSIVIHLGQLKPLFGRHSTQFPQRSSFSSSVLLS